MQYAQPDQGIFGGEVVANRPAVVMLKSTYDPRMHVTVDGKPAKTQMLAPSFIGVAVPVGTHRIQFQYEPFGYYWELFLIGGARAHRARGRAARLPPLARLPSRQARGPMSAPSVAERRRPGHDVLVVIPAWNEERERRSRRATRCAPTATPRSWSTTARSTRPRRSRRAPARPCSDSP